MHKVTTCGMLLWGLCLLTSSGSPQANEADIIQQIIEDARRNTEGLKSAKARVLVSTRMTPDAGQLYHPPQQKEISWSCKGDMHRYERTTKGAEAEKLPQYSHEIYAYNGQTAKYFVPQAKEGSVRKTDDLADSYHDPRQFGFHYDRKVTIAEALEKAWKDKKVKVLRVEERKGGPWFILQMDVDRDQYEKLYIDGSIGFMIRKRESFSKKEKGRMFSRDEILAYTQYSPGLWFPTQWRGRGFTKNGRIWIEVQARVEDFQPNVEIPDDVFRVDFPLGTRVSDYQSNTVYITSTPLYTFRRTIVALLILSVIIAFRWWRYRSTRARPAHV